MRQLELRRHAKRDPNRDALSPAGRAQAEDVGRESTRGYDAVFVSPAERAAETAAWIVRGSGRQLPGHGVIPGLAGKDETGGSAEGMAAGVRALLASVPEDAVGLAVSHTPFVERAVTGLTGRDPQPFAECEGIRVTMHDDGSLDVEEIRL
ncbi:MAG: histidine phosphatase family protein [Actinomycetota bacterium]|nr:histidine phosphatase family protein [Actinomycetota bacterium]